MKFAPKFTEKTPDTVQYNLNRAAQIGLQVVSYNLCKTNQTNETLFQSACKKTTSQRLRHRYTLPQNTTRGMKGCVPCRMAICSNRLSSKANVITDIDKFGRRHTVKIRKK